MTTPECGTYSGAQSHARRGEECRDCYDAAMIYQRVLRRRRMLGLPLRGGELEEPGWLRAGDDYAAVGAVLRRGWLESA